MKKKGGLAIWLFLALAILLLAGGAGALSNGEGGTWNYYRDITITNPGAALTDYQVLVNLTGASFPTSANTSGADIRFTAAGGNELSYWIENWDYANRNAMVWVNVTSIPAGASTMRMWYGNPSATSTSNGNTTFEFFDDFSASSLDSYKWNISNIVYLENGLLKINESSFTLNGVISKQKFSLPKIMEFSMNKPQEGTPTQGYDFWRAGLNKYLQIGDADRYEVAFIHSLLGTHDKARAGVYSGSNNYNYQEFSLPPDAFHRYKISWEGVNTRKFFIDGSQAASVSTPTLDTDLNVSFQSTATTTGSFFVDWIFVRKYASTEPSVSVGAEQGLVAEYHFDGDAKDSSGKGNDGTINGATFVQGVSGQALSFDGVDDYVAAGDNGFSSGTSPKTVSAWIKTNDKFATTYGGGYGMIFGYGTAESYTNMFFVGVHSQGNIIVTQYGDSYISSGDDVFDKWHHIAVTYDGTIYRTYIDGVQRGSKGMPTNTILSGNSYIGDIPGYSEWIKYSGVIDEVRIYNRALTDSEIKAQYDASKPQYLQNLWKTNLSSTNLLWPAVGDLNGDGIKDVVSGNSTRVYALNGANGQTLWTYDFGSIWGLTWPKVKDVDGDGRLEVLVGSSESSSRTSPGKVIVLNNQGQVKWMYNLSVPPQEIAADDIDGDGKTEVIFGLGAPGPYGSVPGYVYVVNGTTGSFLWSFAGHNGHQMSRIVTGDLNGDGIKEIIAGDWGWESPGSYVYAINGVTHNTIWSYWANTDIFPITVEDTDNDSIPELIFSHNTGTSTVTVLNGSNGNRMWEYSQSGYAFWPIAGDINGDGKKEVTSRHATPSNAVLYVFNGTTGSVLWSNASSDNEYGYPSINDVNNDGINEIIVAFYNLTIFNGSDGSILQEIPLDSAGKTTLSEDLNGDGTKEVVAIDASGNVYLFGKSSIQTPAQFTASISSPPQQTFPFGTPINFTSQVTGGAPPYAYSWESSREGIISTAPSFAVSNLSIGTHTITLTVTDANGSKATDTKVVTITGVDLGIKSSDISFSNSWPMQNEEITINASITNYGPDSAGSVSLRFYDGALLIGEELIPSISHRSSSVAQIRYAPSISGYRLIKVVVDEANSITEGDETNNIAIRPIAVGNGNFYGGIEMSAFIDTPKYTGEYTRVYGSAIYNTTFGSGEKVAGALVTITIDEKSYTTYTTSSGTFSTDIIAPFSSGQYPVAVRITDNTFVKEESLMLTVNDWPDQLPDLVITSGDITFPQGAYVANESSTVNARILNVGREDASGATVSFYDDGVLFETRTISSIPKYGGSVTTSGIFTPSYSGTHTITVKVDANNTIPETNEDNNQAFRSLYVYPDLPDFTPSYIYYSDSTPYDGQTVTVYSYIANIGGKNGAANVSFYLDNNIINTVPVSVQGRNGYAIASLPITFTNPGTHQVKIIVDEAGNVGEADEGNNQLTGSIYVHTPQPDLRADDIFLNISDPVSGDSVLVTGVLRNDGETSANNVIANLYIGGLLVNSTTILTLAAGSAETITSSWLPVTNGYFDIQLSLDPLNTIAESNEYNNVRTETYYVYPDLPDPYPISLVSTPSKAEIGHMVNIEAVIRNKGGISTGMMNISFYDNDMEISSSRVEVLGKGGTVPVSTAYSFSTNGTHSIKVRVDPDNAVSEFDESNNELVNTTYILPPLPDLIVEGVTFDNSSPKHNDIINITAAIRNIGQISASNVKVAFYHDGVKIGETTVPEIAVLETNSTTITWTAIGGRHTIRAVADPYSEIDETSDANNGLSRLIDVLAPDIQVLSEDIYFSDNNPMVDENVVIYANISDAGTYQAENIGVEFYIDDILINTTTIASISNKSSVMVTTDWIAKGTGSHVVRIETIFAGFELSGTNNVATRGLVVRDTVPPAGVTNLHNLTYASTYINWTWTDPSDPDFTKVMVYLDGVYKNDILKGIQYYNATGLAPSTYTIGTRTVDTSGNINATMVTHTATTILPTIRFINGTVMDSVNKTGIAGVKVSINTSISTNTNVSGFYSFAVTSGTYNITASLEPAYYTNSTVVSTALSAIVVQDIQLIEKTTGNITGSVTKA